MVNLSESATSSGAPALNPRLEAMLRGPIARTLFRQAAPNTVVMCAQAATSLIQTWFLAKLGTDVLAGVGVVIPLLMLMQNMSQGAMGGGISSAVARALGTGSAAHANDLVRHALAINVVLGVTFAGSIWLFSPYLYPLLGASGGALTAALEYSDVTCLGIALLWIMNAFASVIRGTGNMLVPGGVILGGFIILIPVTPCLIFGYGPFPGLGVAGAAWALAAYYFVGTVLLGWFCLSGKSIISFTAGKLSWQPIKNILTVGAVACVNAFLTNTIIAVTGAIVGAYAGTAALAGYATSARIEYFLMPVAFGIGAPMVAMISLNIGAGQLDRARVVALTGGFMAFVLAEIIGLVVAVWPQIWLGLFGADTTMLEVGSTYLRIVGPFYGFFALGFSLYFASQGAGRLKWPLVAGALRLIVCIGSGWAVLAYTHALSTFFAVSAAALFLYGAVIFWSVYTGMWFKR